jgi:2-oxoglutaroyl-CoA hydrolase
MNDSSSHFSDPRLAKLDGFHVEIDGARERADIVLDRPPFNVIEMDQRDQLRFVFEALDEDARVRVIVLRAVGEHFSSGGNAVCRRLRSTFRNWRGTSARRHAV